MKTQTIAHAAFALASWVSIPAWAASGGGVQDIGLSDLEALGLLATGLAGMGLRILTRLGRD